MQSLDGALRGSSPERPENSLPQPRLGIHDLGTFVLKRKVTASLQRTVFEHGGLCAIQSYLVLTPFISLRRMDRQFLSLHILQL